jgi:arsenite transporter
MIRQKGEAWFKTEFLPKFKPVSIIALLLTLILLFAFQGPNILNNPLIIVLIAVPLDHSNLFYFLFGMVWRPETQVGASNMCTCGDDWGE